MSGYLCLDCELESTELLTKALDELGLAHTEHDPPVRLHGYRGDERLQLAHIIVPKASLNMLYTGCSNDLGFLFNTEKNSYDMFVSEYDAAKEVHKRVTQAYIMVGVRDKFLNEGIDTDDNATDLRAKRRKDVTVFGKAII